MTKNSSADVKKILIIEDEGDICLLLNIILKDHHIDLDHVKTIALAKEYLQQEKPALVMLDNKLPDGLGMDFISFIRSTYPDTRIMMISGFHAAEARDLALENGADKFLEKPFTRDQVYQAVQELLQQAPAV